ncbi:MAG TPA: TIM barrel protein [Anaerolineae bacterium]|nr:TIM barrel protein [Anaerolineae bacterium]HQK14274.1 TIM barrel protein [Anaerolineae bacterium]
MRLGAPVFVDGMTPDHWIVALKRERYGAAYCPVTADADPATVRAYAKAAEKADIVIAEVGVWNNPLSADAITRAAALEKCQIQLALADEIGARCCVNIAGSRGEPWDGPDPANFTEETFEMIVETVRTIIDAVRPQRTYYTLEPMPWMYPDSADSYLRLIAAIDRPHFAVHIDMVNVINSPQRYFDNAALIREWFAKLGPYIRSCHAKDTLLSTKLTTHLDEVRPGLGYLDYRTLLRELSKLDPDTPLMIEHLHAEEDYRLSAKYIRSVADEIGVTFR